MLRPAAADDLEHLLRLFDELAEGGAARRPGEAEASRAVLDAILANPARHLVVAVADSQRVGSADLVVVPNLTHHGRP